MKTIRAQMGSVFTEYARKDVFVMFGCFDVVGLH